MINRDFFVKTLCGSERHRVCGIQRGQQQRVKRPDNALLVSASVGWLQQATKCERVS